MTASSTYLPFEQDLARLDADIACLLANERVDRGAVRRLRTARRRLEGAIVARLTPWERVQLSRHPDRPGALDYLARLFDDFVELHGDRRYGDDPAIVGGPARFHGRAVMVVAQQRGRGPEGARRNFGMPMPEGYRKAVRLFELADRCARPIVTLVDTPGAYPGVGAEERGQAEAIASCLEALATVRVPVIAAIIGEGGSGGALALAIGNVVLMQEHAWYSVLSPEGCASILFRDRGPDRVARSAGLLGLTATDLAAAGVVDEIVPEPAGGAHRSPARAAVLLGRTLAHHLDALARRSPAATLAARRARYRRAGTGLPPA